MLTIYACQTEHLTNPMGIDALQPRFSWKLKSDRQGVAQTSYRITVTAGELSVWDSGEVQSNETRFIRYAGAALQSRSRYQWQVQVKTRDAQGQEENAISNPAYFEMGLLHPQDWQAKWIEAGDWISIGARKPAVYLRRPFTVKEGLIRAVFYSTAHGLYEFYLNGAIGTQDKFKSGLTSYYARIQYHTADVTSLLRQGDNVLAVVLADGWWRGVTGGSVINNFGTKLAFFGQLELTYNDGTTDMIASDESFAWSSGGLRAADMLMGGIYDATLEPSGWKEPTFPRRKWAKAHLTQEHTDAKLIACRSVPVREKERFHGQEIKDAAGNRIIDFGQNIAGYVRMTLRNTKRGQTVRLIHGETLDENGVFTLKNIRNTSLPVDAFQEVTYICAGAEVEIYQPDFAIFGFRYLWLPLCQNCGRL